MVAERERLGARAEEVILIDDRQENVTAAGQMGIRGLRFNGPEQARAELTGMLAAGGLLFPLGLYRTRLCTG
jgi:FMN phosphatase YigB (HAD superfamily)